MVGSTKYLFPEAAVTAVFYLPKSSMLQFDGVWGADTLTLGVSHAECDIFLPFPNYEISYSSCLNNSVSQPDGDTTL